MSVHLPRKIVLSSLAVLHVGPDDIVNLRFAVVGKNVCEIEVTRIW